MESDSGLREEYSYDSMDWTPSPTQGQLNLAAWLPGRPFQPGLGSLGVLPPEIRSKIWELVLPQSNDCFELEPLKVRNWTVVDIGKVRAHNTLALVRASKQLYQEVTAQFYKDRSLALIFATAVNIPTLRQPKAWRPWSSMFGLHINGIDQDLWYMDFAKFTSIKLLIELPHPRPIGPGYDYPWFKVGSVSRALKNWQTRRGLHVSLPNIQVILYNRAPWNSLRGIRIDDMYPNLQCLHHLVPVLQPLRDLQNVKDATVEADIELDFGWEWLPELLSQVADDMQKGGRTRPGQPQWRQRNMEVALAQSNLEIEDWPAWAKLPGRHLPIGPPEEPPDDGIE
ncbi:MAG: hypothetical protein L6R38_003800 [Xanthoria sp. 2 TBL-2021]|nr:MAG: hypothetical protein L6R38_003800 [Xanthoria sp. 2 TBL-2021]